MFELSKAMAKSLPAETTKDDQMQKLKRQATNLMLKVDQKITMDNVIPVLTEKGINRKDKNTKALLDTLKSNDKTVSLVY